MPNRIANPSSRIARLRFECPLKQGRSALDVRPWSLRFQAAACVGKRAYDSDLCNWKSGISGHDASELAFRPKTGRAARALRQPRASTIDQAGEGT